MNTKPFLHLCFKILIPTGMAFHLVHFTSSRYHTCNYIYSYLPMGSLLQLWSDYIAVYIYEPTSFFYDYTSLSYIGYSTTF